MSSRSSRIAAGLIALAFAGGAVACPGAAKNASQTPGQGSSAQTTPQDSQSSRS